MKCKINVNIGLIINAPKNLVDYNESSFKGCGRSAEWKNRLDTFLLLKCKSDTSNLPWGEMFPADRQNQTRIKWSKRGRLHKVVTEPESVWRICCQSRRINVEIRPACGRKPAPRAPNAIKQWLWKPLHILLTPRLQLIFAARNNQSYLWVTISIIST